MEDRFRNEPGRRIRSRHRRSGQRGLPARQSAHVDRHIVDWWRFIATSPSLQARLAAGIIVLTVSTARKESVRAFDQGASDAGFFATFEDGFDALQHLTRRRDLLGGLRPPTDDLIE
jgi:hypothetical protein